MGACPELNVATEYVSGSDRQVVCMCRKRNKDVVETSFTVLLLYSMKPYSSCENDDLHIL